MNKNLVLVIILYMLGTGNALAASLYCPGDAVQFEEINVSSKCLAARPSTDSSEHIINNDKEYQVLKTEWPCLKNELPSIDFAKKTLLGKWVDGDCKTNFKKTVQVFTNCWPGMNNSFWDNERRTILYSIQKDTPSDTKGSYACPASGSMNFILIPVAPGGCTVEGCTVKFLIKPKDTPQQLVS